MRSWGGHSRKNYIPKISKFNVEKGYLVYQQITFSMLSRFCQLSKTPPTHPVFNGQNHAGWTTKQN